MPDNIPAPKGEIPPYIKAYFAHQPIFNNRMEIWGYELFYRDSSQSESAEIEDGIKATMEVLSNLILSPDDDFRQARVVINFSVSDIIRKVPFCLKPETTIVQIADPVELAPGLMDSLSLLVHKGYTLSIDDYRAEPKNMPIYEKAGLFTISVPEVPEMDLRRLINAFPELNAMYLAKRVETKDQHDLAKECGFHLFQGYFFKKPVTSEVRKLTSNEALRFKLLKKLSGTEVDFNSISELIEHDVSLSMRLLKLLNSPAYGLRSKITSIKQAVVYLGWSQLTHWLKVVLLTDMRQPEKTIELTRLSLQRAHFLESLGEKSDTAQVQEKLFLLGLFSLLDVMLELPMGNILAEISVLDDEINKTMSGHETRLTPWVELYESMEESDWERVGTMAAILDLEADDLLTAYKEALTWANHVLSSI